METVFDCTETLALTTSFKTPLKALVFFVADNYSVSQKKCHSFYFYSNFCQMSSDFADFWQKHT